MKCRYGKLEIAKHLFITSKLISGAIAEFNSTELGNSKAYIETTSNNEIHQCNQEKDARRLK